MNILHLVNHAGRGGSEQYVLALAKRQLAMGCEVVFVYNENGELTSRMRTAGAVIKHLEMDSPFDMHAAKELAGICRKYRIDVVHTHFPRENCIAINAKLYYRPLSVVNTCHLVYDVPPAWQLINRIYSPHNRAVIAVCRQTAEKLARGGVSRKKIYVVPNGVNVRPDPDAPKKREAIRREFGIAQDAPLVVTLTRYERIKGVDILIDAAAELCIKVPKARVLIAGGGDDYDLAHRRIEGLDLEGKVIQAGFRMDCDAIVDAADIYANTSRSEAFSFAIIEAMAAGNACAVTDVGGNADIIGDDGSCGIIVPPEDSHAFARALIKLASDTEVRRQIAENSRKRVKENFTENIMFNKTMKLYGKKNEVKHG